MRGGSDPCAWTARLDGDVWEPALEPKNALTFIETNEPVFEPPKGCARKDQRIGLSKHAHHSLHGFMA